MSMPQPPGTPVTQSVGNCLDADAQGLIGSLPSTGPGPAGHAAAVDIFFTLLDQHRPAVFCDIGANRGEAGRRAKALMPDAQVFGFEANPRIHARFADLNTSTGVHWVNAAVADRQGTLSLYIPRTLTRALNDETLVGQRVREARDTGKSSLLQRDEAAEYDTVEVPAVTLDTYLATHAPEGRVALWIDVEGAASTVLAGAPATLARTDLIVVEVEGFSFWRDQALALQVLNHLQSRGFVPVLRDREYNDAQFNVLCLRDGPDLARHRRGIGQALDQTAPAPTSTLTPASVPVLIPTFNNPSYCEGMLTQLRAVGFTDITFVDNASDSPAMHAWLNRAEVSGTRTERLDQNLGPRASIFTSGRLANLPRHFCVTDPDLRFNDALPDGFLGIMADAMSRHRFGKAGFALDISDRTRLRPQAFSINGRDRRIWEWERWFWAKRLDFTPGGDPVFKADIDTTFALYDQETFRPDRLMKSLRLGGRFTATHLPWLAEATLPVDEADLYRASQKHSSYDAKR